MSVTWKKFVDDYIDGDITKAQPLTAEKLKGVEADFESQWSEREMPKFEIPADFFNFKFQIKTQITGESVDRTQRNDAYYNVLTWVQSNPGIVNIPYFKQYCEENGINYWRLGANEIEQLQQTQSQAPAPANQNKPDKLMSAVNATA